MTIDDMDGVRARLAEDAAGPEPWDWSQDERDLRALLDDHARLAAENEVFRRGIAAAVPDYPHQFPDGSGHPWPLVPVAAVLAVDAKMAACEAERRAAVESAIAHGREVDRLTRERDDARAALSVRYALAREVEVLLGVPEGPACPEQLAAGVAAVRGLLADRDRLAAALAEVRALVQPYTLPDVPMDECPPRTSALRAVLAATPADIATARDAWGRAGGDSPALYDSRAEWSRRTFGEGDRYKGVVEHIRRELVEIERDPADIEEWVDVVMLAMDGAWRSAGADGATFWAAFRAKAAKNEAREWAPPDAAGVVEHVRAEAERARLRAERGSR